MFHPRLFITAVAICLANAAYADDTRIGDLRIAQSYARATAPGQPAAAVYLIIENQGKSRDRLVGASTAVAKSVELHTMTREGDVMRMREVGDISIQPGATVAMKPGEGYHLMLFGLKAPLKKEEQVPMTLVFERAGKKDILVKVMDRGAAAPGSHTQHGSAHRH